MLRSNEDLTTRLVTRYWMHSAGSVDFHMLDPFLLAAYDQVEVQSRSPRGQVIAQKLFKDILLGAGSFRHVLAKFQWSFAHLHGRNCHSKTIDMLYLLYGYGSSILELHVTDEPDFVRTLIHAKGFWRSVFQLLHDVARGSPLHSPSPSATDLLYSILQVISAILGCPELRIRKETSDYSRVLVRAGSFDVLDEVLPCCGSVPASGQCSLSSFADSVDYLPLCHRN